MRTLAEDPRPEAESVKIRLWRDLLGALKVQAEALDQKYLDHWAKELGVTDLLLRARKQAGLS